MKIYIANNYTSYGHWLKEEITTNIEEADLIIFAGGEDVNPEFYGEEPIKNITFNTERDLDELLIYNYAIENNIPMLGICRGSQLLCVANGGRLIQHVNNHGIGGMHKIEDIETKEIYSVTSTHHQMAFPFNLEEDDYKIIAKSSPSLSDYYIKEKEDQYNKEDIVVEPEIIFYPKTICLGLQYHPEYMSQSSEAVKYTKNLINKYLFEGKELIKLDVEEENISGEFSWNMHNKSKTLFYKQLRNELMDLLDEDLEEGINELDNVNELNEL